MSALELLTAIWPQRADFIVLALVFITLLLVVIAFANSRR